MFFPPFASSSNRNRNYITATADSDHVQTISLYRFISRRSLPDGAQQQFIVLSCRGNR